MVVVTVKRKFQVTIPDQVAKQLNLSIGDLLEVKAERGRILLLPKMLVDRKPPAAPKKKPKPVRKPKSRKQRTASPAKLKPA